MSNKRKRDNGQTEVERRSEPKRRKHERRVPPDGNGVVKLEERAAGPPRVVGELEQAPSASEQQKNPSRRKRKPSDSATLTASNDPIVQGTAVSHDREQKIAKRRERKRKKHERLEKGKHERRRQKNPQWSVSEPVGGRMLNMDPLFSPDEEYLLLAYDMAVRIYSTKTSLLVRNLRTRKSDTVSGIAFSSGDPEHLYVATSSGITEKWNWVNGTRLEFWNAKVPIHTIRTVPSNGAEDSNGLVYTVDRQSRDRWMVTAHRLMGGQEASKTDLVVLLVYRHPLTSLKILEHGSVIAATAGSSIIIGTTERVDKPMLKDVTYIWREFKCSEWITSVDVRIQRTDAIGHSSSRSDVSLMGVDIVVGGLKGAIFIYEDVLRKLMDRENRSQTLSHISPRKLHWHRNTVWAVKWSADGNYIISGGEETVLVLWQLDTGQSQSLPHLSAAIEGIVVSPSGSSYAIRLADNSAMILSTSELQPTFSVTGVQIPVARKSNDQGPFLPKIVKPYELEVNHYTRLPATVNPASPGRLLLAVPAAISLSDAPIHPCYLQTLDTASGQQIARQALTRTNVTTRNIGPESNRIEEPSVTHMQISCDGQWLATVDEWLPPERDLTQLAFDDEQAIIEQHLRLEVFMRFWSWDERSGSWALVSRVDNPHATVSGEPRKINDLASDPSVVGFASLSEDGMVRAWKPAIRKRHGLDVRATEGQTLMTWSCRQTIGLPVEEGKLGKLSYSEDGSVLVAAFESSLPSSVYLIDTEIGELRSSPTNIFTGLIFAVGILHRYLIVLGDNLYIWDMVLKELHSGFILNAAGLSLEQRRTTTHLAINHRQQTFAIAIPESGSKFGSQVGIFKPEWHNPLFTTSLPDAVTSLLPFNGRIGYHCIDAAAEIRTLMPEQNLPAPAMALPSGHEAPVNGLANIYGDGKAIDGDGGQAVLKLSSMHLQPDHLQEEGIRYIHQKHLAEVFESSSSMALPSVADMFEKVAMLLVGR